MDYFTGERPLQCQLKNLNYYFYRIRKCGEKWNYLRMSPLSKQLFVNRFQFINKRAVSRVVDRYFTIFFSNFMVVTEWNSFLVHHTCSYYTMWLKFDIQKGGLHFNDFISPNSFYILRSIVSKCFMRISFLIASYGLEASGFSNKSFNSNKQMGLT